MQTCTKSLVNIPYLLKEEIILKILYPVIKGKSGGDVYFERLSDMLSKLDIQSHIQYYPANLQLFPNICKYFYYNINDYDIIHSVSDWGYAFKDKTKPLVIVAHHLSFEPQAYSYVSIKQRLFYKLSYKYNKESFNRADKIITMSHYTKEMIRKLFGTDNVEVIYNGVDTNQFRPLIVKDCLYMDKIKILYVGNLIKRKGAHLLPKIMSKLDKRFILFYTSGLRTKTNLFNNEHMVPLGRLSLNDLIKMYNLCDILIVPSVVEGGFSYAAAEAMACEKPIIASKNSGLYEMIGDKGGAICETIDDFVKNIIDIGQDDNLKKSIGKYNRKTVINKYNISQMGNNYKHLYENLIAT